jgi:RNA polymerase subunit RPABC4/transcription elongation factor Spt4
VTGENGNRQQLIRAAVKLAIGIAALLILQAVVASLSVLNQVVPLGSVYITYAALGQAALQTAIFVLLIKFGLELRPTIETLLPTVREIGLIFQCAVWLIPVALAYAAYSDLAQALLGSSIIWLYQLVFALIAGGLLLTIGALVFRNLDSLTDFAVHDLPRHLPRWPTLTKCRSCGAGISARAQFCPSCGKSVTTGGARQAAEEKTALRCPQCQAAITAAQRFCRACGGALQAS